MIGTVIYARNPMKISAFSDMLKRYKVRAGDTVTGIRRGDVQGILQDLVINLDTLTCYGSKDSVPHVKDLTFTEVDSKRRT